jgi:protease-4
MKKILSVNISDRAAVTIAVVCSVALSVCVVSMTAAGMIGNALGSNTESKAYTGPQQSYVAKIKIVGEIGGSGKPSASSDSAYHHDWTMETIDALIEDKNNRGLYLWVDSPGGSVYESDALYLKLMEYKEQTKRPVYAYMGQMAASGGYYVAAASDEIYANRNTWTGSIGVTLGTLFDVSAFLEEHGIRTDTITSGRNKAMGSYYTPLSDEQKAIYQGLVDEAYDRFVAIVAEGRELPEEDVRALADGRLYTAAQALDAGLIDGIFGEQEAEEAVKEKFEEEIVIDDCYYRPDANYLSFLGSFAEGGFSIFDLLSGRAGAFGDPRYEGDVAAVLSLAQEQAGTDVPPILYLYAG